MVSKKVSIKNFKFLLSILSYLAVYFTGVFLLEKQMKTTTAVIIYSIILLIIGSFVKSFMNSLFDLILGLGIITSHKICPLYIKEKNTVRLLVNDSLEEELTAIFDLKYNENFKEEDFNRIKQSLEIMESSKATQELLDYIIDTTKDHLISASKHEKGKKIETIQLKN